MFNKDPNSEVLISHFTFYATYFGKLYLLRSAHVLNTIINPFHTVHVEIIILIHEFSFIYFLIVEKFMN